MLYSTHFHFSNDRLQMQMGPPAIIHLHTEDRSCLDIALTITRANIGERSQAREAPRSPHIRPFPGADIRFLSRVVLNPVDMGILGPLATEREEYMSGVCA